VGLPRPTATPAGLFLFIYICIVVFFVFFGVAVGLVLAAMCPQLEISTRSTLTPHETESHNCFPGR
jgi:predicted lysophospholipase L1 biosynthesis ABC-type transport system permease subunit